MIRNSIGLILAAGFLFLFTGCPYGYKYDEGRFPSKPVNFAAVNSIYDDYNSTSPVIESERYLYFSSNRNSNGAEFDIIGENFHIFWDKDNGRLTVDNSPPYWKDYRYTDSLFAMINTGYNELGPYSLQEYNYTASESFYNDLIVFSNDESGNLDLKFVFFTGSGENPAPDEGSYEGPEPITFLNTVYNDAYLTFYGPDFFWNGYNYPPSNITELLFCSDRDGDFNIYQSAVPFGLFILLYLGTDNGEPVYPVDILNSASQDKCPYVDGELLVFTSDRPGGYGGFDLYYSRRDGNTWLEPVNFGEKINTEYDEYRPIVMQNFEFVNDLMLFSSNRPGGKGGYDLYYVGIPKMIAGDLKIR
jgi:hypothetical protein